ncbi:hypothetical protein LBMAG27_23550 [Bacteroidota bacterium]|nr:hypothetical protein LBMAG27_23550 [Bacteroidota bacterium]
MSTARKIETEINHYLSHLSDSKKKAVLTVVKSFAEQEEKDLWDELPEEIKASVLIGLEESKSGKGKPHSAVMKKYSQWLKK